MALRAALFIFISIMPLCNGSNNHEWTWVHTVHCNKIARVHHKHKKNLFFEKDTVNSFTQLVFSWNAIRPKEGYFSFYAQVRNATTKKWGAWHHMMDWGANKQQSYASKSDGFSTFVHVRLEIENKKLADAFRIKVIPQNKASLSLVHNLSVALSDFTLFKLEPLKSLDNSLDSVLVKGVPLQAQLSLDHEDSGRICSPVSCAMVVGFLTGQDKDPLVFATQSFDQGLSAYGSWPCNIAHAFESAEGKFRFYVRRMNSFIDLYAQLKKGMPIVVSVRGTLAGALKPFPHGHLIVVVGWDKDARMVLCHDPAAESNDKVAKAYPLEDFLRGWESSHRLSYVAEHV